MTHIQTVLEVSLLTKLKTTLNNNHSSRVSEEEDGDLSEVQSDAVPNEVRKWLETTFTRNSISHKRKSDDKLKFRSVANAIRAGIVVDRIYRRMSASTPFVSQEVSSLLKSIDDWSFNCFQINQVSQGQVLKSVGYELFNRYGLLYKFKIPTNVLKNFLQQIEQGYTKHKNPYHNNLHAADVTQTVHYMLWQAGLTNWLSDLEIFATLLAAIIHDYLHTGTTNNFHVMSQSETALIYNDRAVLENFHISQAFSLMRQEECNILSGLSKDEYREFRSLVIDMVLATDMSSHFQQIKAMKSILNHSDNFSADKSKILSLVIHISDISHPAKDWGLHSQWTSLLMEEFFLQGDREKELDLECSPLCDRDTTLVAESQLGFIEFIVSPSLEICGDVLDRVHMQMAEANARPLPPASAKAASVMAAVTTGLGSSGAPPPAVASGGGQNKACGASLPAEGRPNAGDSSRNQKVTATMSTATISGNKTSGGGKQEAGGNNNNRQPFTGSSLSVASNQSGATVASTDTSNFSSSSSSFASSFVSSETLASNLRKMIVSSSASLSRKLNISGHQAQPTQASPVQASQSSQASARAPPREETAAEFEARQANYKHPVIQCSSSRGANSSGLERARSATPSGSAALANLQPVERLELAPNSNRVECHSAMAQQRLATSQQQQQQHSLHHQASRSAPPLQYFKIQRPWIACLERNKKMWRERALAEQSRAELRQAKQETPLDLPKLEQ